MLKVVKLVLLEIVRFPIRGALKLFRVPSSSWERFRQKLGLKTANPLAFPLDSLGRVALGSQNLSKFSEQVVAIADMPHDPYRYTSFFSSSRESVSVEIVQKSKNSTISKDTYPEMDIVIIPVGSFGKTGTGTLETPEGRVDLSNIAPYRLSHFRLSLSSGQTLTVDQTKLIAGSPIPETQKILKQSGKVEEDITVIFIDGLASEFFTVMPIDSLMPNTSRFFSDARTYENFVSCAEWTLPSVASVFTGQEPILHNVWRPRQTEEFDQQGPILSEILSGAGYFTSMIGGNWRIAPGYGYARGFDKYLYKKNTDVDWSISQHIEIREALKQRSHFSWISVNEIHPPWPKVVPSLNLQVDIPHSFLSRENFPAGIKSPYETKSHLKETSYKLALRELDEKLVRLYEYISKKEELKPQTVILLSDHGQKYLTQERSVLSGPKTRTPLMIRGSGIVGETVPGYVQSSDIGRILLDSIGVENAEFFLERPSYNFGGIDKGFTFSESIFPGRPYLCRINHDSGYLEFSSNSHISKAGILTDFSLHPVNLSANDYFMDKPVEDIKIELQDRLEANFRAE